METSGRYRLPATRSYFHRRAATRHRHAAPRMGPARRMVDGAMLDELAQKIAASSMSRYAAQYMKSSESDPKMFRSRVLEFANSVVHGIMQSIGDSAELLAAVVQHLAAKVPLSLPIEEEVGQGSVAKQFRM